jgi:hypothetical protein
MPSDVVVNSLTNGVVRRFYFTCLFALQGWVMACIAQVFKFLPLGRSHAN